MCSYGFPKNSYGSLCVPMHSLHFYAFLWIPFDFYQIRMDSYVFPCVPMDSYASLCDVMCIDSNAFLWIPKDSYVFPCLPQIPIECLMDSYGFLEIILTEESIGFH